MKNSWQPNMPREIDPESKNTRNILSVDDLIEELEEKILAELNSNISLLDRELGEITPEMISGMSNSEKIPLIDSLAKIGFSEIYLDTDKAVIGFKLSPKFPLVTGCTIFKIILMVGNLEGSLNKGTSEKATLLLSVPLGGEKELFRWELLIMKLAPWLSVRLILSSEEAITSVPAGKTNVQTDPKPENPAGQHTFFPEEHLNIYNRLRTNILDIQVFTNEPLKTDFTNVSALIQILEKTAETLQEIAWYRNADELAVKCKWQINQLQKETYRRAKTAMNGSGGKAGYEYAMKLFRQIPGYRDADDLALDCEKKTKELLKKEKPNRPNFSVIALSLLLIILISALVVISFSQGTGQQDLIPETEPATEPAAEQTSTPTSDPSLNPEWLNTMGYLENQRKNYERAFYYFRTAAEMGHLMAQYNLGLMYIKGTGTEKSPEMAVKYFEMAAEGGLANAQFDLGLLYYQGDGVEKSYEMAVKYWKMAADQGYVKALNNLGFMYENGYGVPVNYEIAMEYYQQSADKGNKNGKKSLEELQQKIEKTEMPAATIWPEP